ERRSGCDLGQAFSRWEGSYALGLVPVQRAVWLAGRPIRSVLAGDQFGWQRRQPEVHSGAHVRGCGGWSSGKSNQLLHLCVSGFAAGRQVGRENEGGGP